MSYQIYSDATADICPSMREGLLTAEIIPMEVTIGDRSYTYGPGGDLTVEQFYAEQRAGCAAERCADEKGRDHLAALESAGERHGRE